MKMNNIDFTPVGILIKKLRKENKLTIQNLADLLHVSKAAVSQWENGSGMKTELLYDIAKYFDISVSELIAGKLNTETNIDYFKRNYDLSKYDFDGMIDDSNVEQLKELFLHCGMVKAEFFSKLPQWASNKMKKEELEMFNLIKQYFKFDLQYYAYLKESKSFIFFISEENEKEQVREVCVKYKDADSSEFQWQLSKLYTFTFDIKREKICQSRN